MAGPGGKGYGFLDDLLRAEEAAKALAPVYDPSGGATLSSGPALSEAARNAAVKEFQDERYGRGGAVDEFKAGNVGQGLLEIGKGAATAGGAAAGANLGLLGILRLALAKAMRGQTPGASTPYASPYASPYKPSPGAVGPLRLGESSPMPGSSTPYASPYSPSPGAVGPFRLGEGSPTSTPHDALGILRRGSRELYPEPDPNLRFLHYRDPASFGAKSDIYPATKFLKQKDFVLWLLEQGLLK